MLALAVMALMGCSTEESECQQGSQFMACGSTGMCIPTVDIPSIVFGHSAGPSEFDAPECLDMCVDGACSSGAAFMISGPTAPVGACFCDPG